MEDRINEGMRQCGYPSGQVPIFRYWNHVPNTRLGLIKQNNGRTFAVEKGDASIVIFWSMIQNLD